MRSRGMLGSLVVVIVIFVFEFALKVNCSGIATEVKVNCPVYGVAARLAFVSYLPLVTVVLAGDFERQLVILDLDVLRETRSLEADERSRTLEVARRKTSSAP